MTTLNEIKKGQKAKIISFGKNICASNFARFALFEGQTIECIAKNGPVIIKENRQTIAISKSLSKKIFIETLGL